MDLINEVRRPTSSISGGPGLDVRRGADGNTQIARIDNPPIWIRLTTSGSSGKHEWKPVIWAAGAWVDGFVRTIANGDPAYEVSGLNCPKGDEILLARRDDSGRLVFEAKPIEGVTAGTAAVGTITSMTTFPVTVYSSQGGTVSSASLTVTASHRWNVAVTSGLGVTLFPWCGLWVDRVLDCP